MKTQFLFPNKYKKIGWMIFIPSFIVGILLYSLSFDFDDHFKIKVLAIFQDGFLTKSGFFKIIENGVLDEIILTLIIIGGILVGFSKVKAEDELIAKIRYESLVWATYFNFGIMLLATLSLYGFIYGDVLIANIFSLLFFFIIRFHYMLYKLQKSTPDEE